jgi:signal peptidase II
VTDVSLGAPEPLMPVPVSMPEASPRLHAVPTAAHAAAPVARRRLGVLVTIAVLAYTADLLSKIAVVATMTEGRATHSLGGVVTFRLIRNPGAAFGLGVGVTIVFTAITTVVIAAILRTSRRLGSLPWAITLGLLLGGALGNLTDRIARSPSPFRGHVIDFIEVPSWPIFNLADSSICLAGAMMVVLAFRNVPLEGGARRH